MLVIGLKLLRGIENPSFAYFDICFFFQCIPSSLCCQWIRLVLGFCLFLLYSYMSYSYEGSVHSLPRRFSSREKSYKNKIYINKNEECVLTLSESRKYKVLRQVSEPPLACLRTKRFIAQYIYPQLSSSSSYLSTTQSQPPRSFKRHTHARMHARKEKLPSSVLILLRDSTNNSQNTFNLIQNPANVYTSNTSFRSSILSARRLFTVLNSLFSRSRRFLPSSSSS